MLGVRKKCGWVKLEYIWVTFSPYHSSSHEFRMVSRFIHEVMSSGSNPGHKNISGKLLKLTCFLVNYLGGNKLG